MPRRTIASYALAAPDGTLESHPHHPIPSSAPALVVPMNPGQRAFVAILLLLVLASALPASATAAMPDRPLPGYRPAFISETVARPPWRDCVWATGAMLLDKWTAGRTTVGFRELHVLGGGHHSSDLADLQQAYARLGIPLAYSPDGGEFTTWRELLVRLEKGGGAILLGDYSKLPRYYGRFDPQFWRNEASSDDHALYLDGYDSARRRVWVMDPLAPPGWKGEWIPVTDLVRYAWHTPGGGLWVAMTPAAEPAPFAGVSIGQPAAAVASGNLIVSWPILDAPKDWTLANTNASTSITILRSGVVAPGPEVLVMPSVVDSTNAVFSEPGTAPVADPAGQRIASSTVASIASAVVASLPMPTSAGAYSVSAKLVEQRFGATVATAGPYVLYVMGDRKAFIAVDASPRSATVGQAMAVTGYVLNQGTDSWADPDPIAGIPMEAFAARNTEVVAHWLTTDPALAPYSPPPVTVEAVPLSQGSMAVIDILVAPPPQPGRWALVLDVADDRGSFARAGSPPVIIPVMVSEASWVATPH